MKLVDTLGLGPSAARLGGSSPLLPTVSLKTNPTKEGIDMLGKLMGSIKSLPSSGAFWGFLLGALDKELRQGGEVIADWLRQRIRFKSKGAEAIFERLSGSARGALEGLIFKTSSRGFLPMLSEKMVDVGDFVASSFFDGSKGIEHWLERRARRARKLIADERATPEQIGELEASLDQDYQRLNEAIGELRALQGVQEPPINDESEWQKLGERFRELIRRESDPEDADSLYLVHERARELVEQLTTWTGQLDKALGRLVERGATALGIDVQAEYVRAQAKSAERAAKSAEQQVPIERRRAKAEKRRAKAEEELRRIREGQ